MYGPRERPSKKWSTRRAKLRLWWKTAVKFQKWKGLWNLVAHTLTTIPDLLLWCQLTTWLPCSLIYLFRIFPNAHSLFHEDSSSPRKHGLWLSELIFPVAHRLSANALLHTVQHTHTFACAKNIPNLLQVLHQLHQQTGWRVLEACFSLGAQGLSCVARSCICMWNPDALRCEFSIGCTSMLVRAYRTHILVIVRYQALSLTSHSVTQILVHSARVLDGALLGKRRKVIAEGIWRLDVQTAPLVCRGAREPKHRPSKSFYSCLKRHQGHLKVWWYTSLSVLWPGEAI